MYIRTLVFVTYKEYLNALDSSGLWEFAREKSDLCESLPGNRKPKTSRPNNNNDRTIACICGQLLVFISRKASETFFAFT